MNRQGRHPYIRAMIKLGQLYALKKLGDKAGEYVEIRLTPKGKKLKKDITNKADKLKKSISKNTDKLIDKGLKQIGLRDYTMIEKIQNSWPNVYHKIGNLTNYGIGKISNLTNYGYHKLGNLTNYGIGKISNLTNYALASFHRAPPNALTVSAPNLSRSRN